MPRRLDVEFLFLTKRGLPLNKSSWHYLWRPVRAAARAEGLPIDDLYELRHAAATMLLERGASLEDVAEQLGNSARVVAQTYGHPRGEFARERIHRAWGANVAELSVVDASKTHRAGGGA